MRTNLKLKRAKLLEGFPGSSAGKESVCNEGDPSSIPGLERSPGEGKDYPLQYSWACLVAQMVNSLSMMQETQVGSLGPEDLLERGMATHSSILAWSTPWTEKPGGPSSWNSKELDMTEILTL